MCDATTILGEIGKDDPEIIWHTAEWKSNLSSQAVSGDNWPHDDPRWPTACERCGGSFDDDDTWQRNDVPVYRRTDGVEFAFRGTFGRSAPPGTIVRATWYDTFSERHPQKAEGWEAWMVSLPDGGEWTTTQTSTDGGHWTLSGSIPDTLTVSPSIFHAPPNGWHGHIVNGELV